MPNSNDLDITKAKGPVTTCRMCKNAGLPLALRTYCKFCLTSGYVHLCLPCNGSGKVGAKDAWGGGSIHRSTCNTCGGIGLIPAREPKEEAPVVAAVPGEVQMPPNAPDGAEVSEGAASYGIPEVPDPAHPEDAKVKIEETASV